METYYYFSSLIYLCPLFSYLDFDSCFWYLISILYFSHMASYRFILNVFSFFFSELNGLHQECKMPYFSLPSSLNTDCVTVCRKMHCNSAKKDPISFCSPCYFSWLYENLFSLSYQKRINRKDKLYKITNLSFWKKKSNKKFDTEGPKYTSEWPSITHGC